VVTRRKLKPRTPHSLRKYGLTVAEWQKMLDDQGGRCLLCGKGGLTKHLSVDHDHTLAKLGIMWVRGLLCQRCNRAIGAFEWSDEVIARVVDYLTRISLTRRQFMDNIELDETDIAPNGARQKGVA
jgi:hypothetical protein